jgi:hypothetical protein
MKQINTLAQQQQNAQRKQKNQKSVKQILVADTAPNQVMHFRKANPDTLINELRLYHKHTKDRYLAGLIHPDIAVKNQIPVKLYSDVPIPTSSVGWHEQYQFTTSSVGTFMMSWRPNFLTSQGFLTASTFTGSSKITFNNTATLTGAVGVAGNSFVPSNYQLGVSIQKYRIVSALIKVSYNGSVLNQAGTMIACATFDPLTAAVGTSAFPVSTFTDSLVDRFGAFSLITNGLWNQSVDITKQSEGVECLYVPLDPADYTFERDGTYLGTATNAGTASLIQPPGSGAPIQYIIAGRNMPASSSCVLVDVYYNYEVIVDPTAAPFMKSSIETALTSADRDSVSGALQKVAKETGFIRPVQSENSKSWAQILKDVVSMGVKYIPKLFL